MANPQYDIVINKINHAEVSVRCFNIRLFNELTEHFRFFIPNYWFAPKVRSGAWDGKIAFLKNGKLPIGLVKRLIRFAEEGNYSYYIDFLIERDVNVDKLTEFIDNLPKPWEPYDFQVESFIDAIRKRNMCIISKTGSGKCIRGVELDIEVSDEVYEKYFKDLKEEK